MADELHCIAYGLYDACDPKGKVRFIGPLLDLTRKWDRRQARWMLRRVNARLGKRPGNNMVLALFEVDRIEFADSMKGGAAE